MTTPNDALDFYPTPDSLAFDMVFSLRETKSGFTTYPKPILEPSAGDGALARQIHALAFNVHHDYKTGEVDRYDKDKARSAELDCIELSSDFRAVLKKNGFRVVHDNFLTFRPTTKYAAIVMNPPFSAGAAHLLKALDVMQDGGKIRCLLNAETLRNPCTNERKELAAKLEELHATVKYIPDAFKNARRAARVEVALVSVDIPDREPVSRIRLDLKNETAERLKENPEFAALVSSDPITAAIERYNAAAEGVRRIYEEYNGIKSLFSSAGAGKKENPVMAFTKSYNDAIRELRGMYWKQLFEMPQLFDAMTYEMQQDYQKRIKELEGYDFSAYNILTVREEISRNLLSSIDHEIIKLFDDWTNLHYNDEYSKNVHYYNGWCTNSAYKINRKVIFRCNAFDIRWAFLPPVQRNRPCCPDRACIALPGHERQALQWGRTPCRAGCRRKERPYPEDPAALFHRHVLQERHLPHRVYEHGRFEVLQPLRRTAQRLAAAHLRQKELSRYDRRRPPGG